MCARQNQRLFPRIAFALLGLTATWLLSDGALGQARFVPLGDLPGGDFGSAARAVSDDGFVAGASRSGEGLEAFFWSRDKGMIGLGDLPGGPFESLGNGVALGGRAVVGKAHIGVNLAFYWTPDGGMKRLGNGDGVGASAITPDGTVVVGIDYNGDHWEAYRWSKSQGMIHLGDLPGGEITSWAFAVNGDGTVVAGRSVSRSGMEAFRWTKEAGMVGLGDLPGGDFYSIARAISADGLTVVGESEVEGAVEVFLWTAEQGMISLGDLPGRSFHSVAYGVSADGSIVVGRSNNPGLAFIWDAEHGMRDLKKVLTEDYGIEIPGWTLGFANAISPNAQYIVGSGENPDGNSEAWIVYLGGSEERCEHVKRLKTKCSNGKLKATLKADLPEGTEFTLLTNKVKPKACVLNDRGKCKVRWKRRQGKQRVSIDECPGVFRKVNCD